MSFKEDLENEGELLVCTGKEMNEAANYFIDAVEYLEQKGLHHKNEKIAVACIQKAIADGEDNAMEQLFGKKANASKKSSDDVGNVVNAFMETTFRKLIVETCPPELKPHVEFGIAAAKKAGITTMQLLDVSMAIIAYVGEEKRKAKHSEWTKDNADDESNRK